MTELTDAEVFGTPQRELSDADVFGEPKTWGGAALSAVKNIPASGGKFLTDLVQPILHPIDTAESLGNLGLGVAEKIGLKSGTENEKYADAIGKFLVDRYGSMDAVKHTLANDPVGLASDISMLLTGGGSAAARLPGIAGKVGGAVSTTGRAVDPLTAVGAAAKGAGNVAATVIGELGTHTGAKSLQTAARAGAEGGEAASAFLDNLRGSTPIEEVVSDARGALSQIRKERGNEYRSGMTAVGADQAVLNFDKIDDALVNISGVQTYKGQSLSPKTQEIRTELAKAVQDWRALDPAEFHTAEGIDALKKKVGDIRDATQYGTPERAVADQTYRAIRQTIVDQVPEYAKVMKGYEEASTTIKEIERTLSLNPNASVDTALRKLQSVLRNNVNTNYGQRAKLAEYLAAAGAPNLMEKLAGQALSAWAPRGLGKMVGTEMLAGSAGAMGFGASGAGAAVLGTLPFMSPRLMGEGAYYAGKASQSLPLRPAAQTGFQVGRTTRAEGTPTLAELLAR